MLENTVTVRCANTECAQYNRPRTVSWLHLGQDVYLTGSLRCGTCGDGAELRHTGE